MHSAEDNDEDSELVFTIDKGELFGSVARNLT